MDLPETTGIPLEEISDHYEEPPRLDNQKEEKMSLKLILINFLSTLKRWFVILAITVPLSVVDIGTDIINGTRFISGGEKTDMSVM